MITRDRALMPTGEPTPELLRGVIREFQLGAPRRDRLRAYYEREHAISSRQRASGLPNNRLSHDFPGYIVAMATGYLVGNAVGYADEKQQAALSPILEAYKRDSIDSVDSEIAADASVYGVGVEIVYAGADSAPHTARVDRRQAFVVYDDTVEHAPMFGVHWMDKRDTAGNTVGLKAFVYTDSQAIPYEGQTLEALTEIPGRAAHYFGGVPLVEYWNNPRETGDFEPVLPLIDAYDVLQSDRVNDKAQFVDALLILYGVQGGFAPPEDPDDKRTPAQRVKDDKLIALPADGKAEWLAKQLNEADVEILKNAIKADIHKFSMVPDLTDEQFAGNSSGVAMKFKLLGLEQLTKIKERWFREGLRWRLRLFSAFMAVKGAPALNADQVQMTFTRALPVNELEIAQMVQTLSGLVPDQLLLSQVPFVPDVKAALDMLERQKTSEIQRQQEAFGGYADANREQEQEEA